MYYNDSYTMVLLGYMMHGIATDLAQGMGFSSQGLGVLYYVLQNIKSTCPTIIPVVAQLDESKHSVFVHFAT